MKGRLELGPLAPLSQLLAAKKEEVVAMIIGSGMRGYALYLARNVRGSPVEFEADPWHVVQAHVASEKYGVAVIGILHTHPSCPPVPSAKDVAGMREWPLIWAISCDRETRAWRLVGDKVEEVPVE